MRTLFVLLVGSLLLSSCVSSKKYKETVSNLQQEHQARTGELQEQLEKLNAEKETLTYDLARSEGGNAALLATQDKLQDRIDQLQAEIEHIDNKASDQQESLSNELAGRDEAINAFKDRLSKIQGVVDRWENAQSAISKEIQQALQPFDSTLCAVDQRGGEVVVVFNEDLVFYSGSTSRFRQTGIDAFQAVSAIIAKYPSLYITIVGHTDNRDVARKSLDNWDYTLLRAGNVAKLLIDEFDLGANRILPAGKSEFSPRTSNETAEGRSENRRMELILSEGANDLSREIKRELDK